MINVLIRQRDPFEPPACPVRVAPEPFCGAVVITPGTPLPAGRGFGFVCTSAGEITLTLADTSTISLPVNAGQPFEPMPFAVTNVALSNGAAGTFWNFK